MPSLKSVSLATLELLAFNAKKITGSRHHGHARFLRIFFQGSRREMRAKFEVHSLAIFEILASNAPANYGVTYPWPRPLLPSFDIRGWRPPRDIV